MSMRTGCQLSHALQRKILDASVRKYLQFQGGLHNIERRPSQIHPRQTGERKRKKQRNSDAKWKYLKFEIIPTFFGQSVLKVSILMQEIKTVVYLHCLA